jgi:hypothetical protein
LFLEHCRLSFDQTEPAAHIAYFDRRGDRTLPTVAERDTCPTTYEREIGYDAPE